MSIQALPQTLPPSTNPTQTIDRYEPSWYQPTLPRLPETARQIFRDYTHIPEDNILEHIYRVRNKAWDVLPYPCIGVFRFLDFGANLSPIYPEVIQRLRAGQTFLDLGCCFGQDIRKLVHDGAPSENIIGADTEARFMDLGYELFRDKETLKARFYAASVFDEDFLSEWHYKIDVIYVGAFLHLFDIEKQALVVARLVELLRRRPGSIVFGRNLGAERGGAFRMKTLGWDVFRHNRETMRLLWEGAPEGDWRVDAELMEYRSEGWDDSRRGWVGDETKEMRFVVRRL